MIRFDTWEGRLLQLLISGSGVRVSNGPPKTREEAKNFGHVGSARRGPISFKGTIRAQPNEKTAQGLRGRSLKIAAWQSLTDLEMATTNT